MPSIRVSRIVKKTRVEGPGLRYCIWMQGCPIRCEGCFNPHTWSFSGGKVISVDMIFDDIKSVLESTPELEGITLMGGEPFAQAGPLSILASRVRKLGLSVVTFTGYEYEHLTNAKNTDWHALLNQTDLLIDGPYIKSLHDLSRPWIGSKNQQYRFLTDFYKPLANKLMSAGNKLEIRIRPDGTITANGMAAPFHIEMLRNLGTSKTRKN